MAQSHTKNAIIAIFNYLRQGKFMENKIKNNCMKYSSLKAGNNCPKNKNIRIKNCTIKQHIIKLIHILKFRQNTFVKLGSLGKPFKFVRPTLIMLRISKFSNSSVNPTMDELQQLSKFNSFI